MKTIGSNAWAPQVRKLRERSRLFWSFALLLCLQVCVFGAQVGVNVLFDLKDARLQSSPSYTNRTVWVQAMSIPNLSSPSVVLGQPIVSVTDSNGEFWITNLTINLYAVTVKAPPRQETFKFLIITNYPGTINAADNLVADSTATFPAGSVAWAAAVTDFRYGGTVPRPAPADGWMLTLSNGIAVWTQNGTSLTNVGGNEFIQTLNGEGTNTDFRWILDAPSHFIRLQRADTHQLQFSYNSGAQQILWHTFDNVLHFDTSPTWDSETALAIPHFDSNKKLVSIPNDTGALTNDGSGDYGWFADFVVDTNGFSTNQFLVDPTTHHVDQLGDPWAFNGQEFWDTNFSSVIPVGRFIGGAVPSFTVNGILSAAKPASSSSTPFTIDIGTPFLSDMAWGRSNGLIRFKVTSDGGINAHGNIISTNGFMSLSATVDTLAYWNPAKVLTSLANAAGTLTNDGFGVLGWYNVASMPTLNGIGTNTSLLNPNFTNAVNYGNAFSSPGSGTASEKLGASASATGTQSTAVGNQAQATATATTALGASSLAGASGATALGEGSTANGVDSTAIGFGATTTTDHQIQMGTSGEWVNVPGRLTAAGITNTAATVSTVAAYDANKKLGSIANGTGWLHDDGSGTFVWSTPTVSFSNLLSGENTSAIMRVGTGAALYPTNSGTIFANYATNVPITGKIGGLNLGGTVNDTSLQQAQGFPTLDWNSAMHAAVGTLFGTGDFSIDGNETNRGFTVAGVITNDANGKKYSSPFLAPNLEGTNTVIAAGSNIVVAATWANGVTTWTIYGFQGSILASNNTFTGANLFNGSSTFGSAVQISANLTVSGNETVTGGITNNSLTANTAIGTDVNKRLVSFANASGALTNDGSGVIGWYVGYAPKTYVDAATNQLAIATTNRINTLGANATNNDLAIGQNATNYANIMYSNAVIYANAAVNAGTNPMDTIVDVNAKITAAATNHVVLKTTDSRIALTTNTATGPTLYTANLKPGITNFDNGFESTNTAVAGSFSLLSYSNLVIKGTAPNVALGTDTNAMLSLNGQDFMFRAGGTNALSITNTLNGIAIHGYWPLDLSFGNSFAGLISSGSATNAAGSRVAYYSEVGNLSASTNVGESITAAQAANYAALSTDEIILMNGNLTVTLPTAIGIKGHSYTIKTVTAGTNAILTTAGQTIDTSAKWTNVSIFKVTRLTSDNANWWITGPNGQ